MRCRHNDTTFTKSWYQNGPLSGLMHLSHFPVQHIRLLLPPRWPSDLLQLLWYNPNPHAPVNQGLWSGQWVESNCFLPQVHHQPLHLQRERFEVHNNNEVCFTNTPALPVTTGRNPSSLGFTYDPLLTFNIHIENPCTQVDPRINVLKILVLSIIRSIL